MLLHRDNTADRAEAQVSAVWGNFIHNYIFIRQNYVRYYRIKLGRVDIQNIHHLFFLKTVKCPKFLKYLNLSLLHKLDPKIKNNNKETKKLFPFLVLRNVEALPGLDFKS